MFSILYLFLRNLFNQETLAEKKIRLKQIQQTANAWNKIISENPNCYCSKCNSFIEPKCYLEFIKMHPYSGLYCLFCGGTITTANNVHKIYSQIREVKK